MAQKIINRLKERKWAALVWLTLVISALCLNGTLQRVALISIVPATLLAVSMSRRPTA